MNKKNGYTILGLMGIVLIFMILFIISYPFMKHQNKEDSINNQEENKKETTESLKNRNEFKIIDQVKDESGNCYNVAMYTVSDTEEIFISIIPTICSQVNP